MEIGGGNIAEGHQYLQGTVGGSAAAPTTANTCSNLPLDNARPVAMETTSNPLSYWPTPSSDLPSTNNTKDPESDGPRKQVPLFDHSYPSNSNWTGEKSQINKCSEPNRTASDPYLHVHSRTHNLPPIAAITSSHNYRGVREAACKVPSEPKHSEQTLSQQNEGGTEGAEKVKSPAANASDGAKLEERAPERPNHLKESPSEYVFSVPTAVHHQANAKNALPVPRAPTPFTIVTASNNIHNHQYHAQPEALTSNISSSGALSGSPSPSNRIAPSPHFLGPSSASNRLSTMPNAPSPSDSPRVPPSPHSNVPSPTSASSRLHSSPHLNLSSPSAEVNRIPSSPHLPPALSSNSNASCHNRYAPALPYAPYPYLSAPKSNSKSLPPLQNASAERTDPKKVASSQNVLLPVRNNQNDTQSCRNPFELPVAKSYPQQQPFQQHYPQIKSTSYYPYPKSGEKDYDAYKRVQPSSMTTKEMYSMDTAQYMHGTQQQHPQQQQQQQQQQQPQQQQQQQQPPPRNSAHQLQREFANYSKPSEIRTWGKSEANDVNQKGSFLNSQNKNNFNKSDYAGNEYSRLPGTQTGGYLDSQRTLSRQSNGGFSGGASFCNNGKSAKTPNQASSLSQRFPPVPQSNYDLNRQIYDRMTGGNQQLQQQQQHHQQQQHRPEKPLAQISKTQMNKPFPYYRDYIGGVDKERPKTYQEYQAMKSRSYGQYNLQPDEIKVMDAYQKRTPNPSYSFIPSEPTSQAVDHHRSMNQNYDSGHQMMQEVNVTEYDKSRFINPQNVQLHKNRPMLSAPVKPKRESPLDLSVKTVRQSADSTAKDDGELYAQNFRSFMGSESRYQMTNGSTGAPKIDFTPNFAGFHTDNQPKAEVASSVLPPVESFKKLTPKSNGTDSKAQSSQSIPAAKPTVEKIHGRYPVLNHYRPEAQKRLSNDPIRSHSSQPKLPKIDAWRLAMDQQIEQRLNSARQSQQMPALPNGADFSKVSATSSQQGSNYSRHSGYVRGAGTYPQTPVQTSATPYNPSMYLHQPQCQSATPQTPQDNVSHRDGVGHSPDPEQIIKQISKGLMPDHKLLQDKNVVSILRSSLEEKEAKLIQLREAARRKEKSKELEAGKKVYHQNHEQNPRTFPQGKQSLPPFGAITLERMCAPPSFPGHKLNVPRPLDTVRIDVEPTQNYLSPAAKRDAEKSGIPSIDPSPQDDAQGPPTDLDGLAAFLAARIRTKAELKQVGPSLDNLRSLSSHQSPKASDLKQGVVPSLGDNPDRLHTTTSQGAPPSGCSITGSPPKLIRESRLLPPLRRRLFSHTDDESSGVIVSGGSQGDDNQMQTVRNQVPLRDPSGIRSSSETSVFDFRESDSEGEMPVLERQTLEGMRRDRKTFGSKQNVSTTTPDDPIDGHKTVEPEKVAELETREPDPFWDTAFDMFVEQLEKRPPKRSVRKKKPNCRLSCGSYAKESEEKLNIFAACTSEAVDSTAKAESKEDGAENDEHGEVKSKFECEIAGNEEKHIKLSANRLRVYRNELMNRENESSRQVEEESITEEVKKDEKENSFAEGESERVDANSKKEDEKPENEAKCKGKKVELRNVRITRGTPCTKEDSVHYDSEIDPRDMKSDSSSAGDDDDSVSISCMESESSDSDSNEESSNSNFSSDAEDEDDFDSESSKKRMRIQTRMQTRTFRQQRTIGMRLRSKAVPLPKATLRKSTKKMKKKRKEEGQYYVSNKKKPTFGDGSYFRPGWEEECYKFKQQLRMPEKLISISRPPKRSSASLPDLDPYRNSPSMSLDSSDVSLTKKSGKLESDESDGIESRRQKRKSNDASSQDSDTALTSLFAPRNGKNSQTNSILNLLVNKYGRLHGKKQKVMRSMTERKSPRVLPRGSDKPELLPTPSLGIGKENVLKDKKRGKDLAKKRAEETDSVYLGYFRRKTVNNFREAFREKGGLLPGEFSPEILKSRTRMQTKVMKKRATLTEVFGEERPASAPPLSCAEDGGGCDVEKMADKKKTKPQQRKTHSGVVTRGKGMLTRSRRPGLRSAAVLRSNKAVQISKRHLNSGRQKRNIDLLRIRVIASKKLSEADRSPNTSSPLAAQKRLKLRSVRRKFRSGFDYIRKKKKMKKESDSMDGGSVKEKKVNRSNSESVADIQSEIKNWVINKGLGETILHRAARLGYTDVAAYCLEKMDCSPSPRDNAGYTPLHEACSRGHLDIAKLLLMYGANVSESGKGGVRPLHEAAENGFTELIRLLLSYGADPLLETYIGHTALSLVGDEEARRLLEHHLADVQGEPAPPWSFQGPSKLFDPEETGCDPLADPPAPESGDGEFEMEASDSMLPPLYRLADDRPDREPWVLLRDLITWTKAKSREAVLKQLDASESCKEMKVSDFLEQARCCNLLGTGERPVAGKASKVILLPYDDKVRQLLSVEKFVV